MQEDGDPLERFLVQHIHGARLLRHRAENIVT